MEFIAQTINDVLRDPNLGKFKSEPFLPFQATLGAQYSQDSD